MPDELFLDRAGGRLFAARGRRFEAAARRWVKAGERGGEPVELRTAVQWLQRDSGTPCRVPIAVIGTHNASAAERDAAFAVGAGVAELGLTLLCGGKGGVMEAACAGAASAGGCAIGLLPDREWQAANPFVTVPIATGIGEARNAIIARAALALVAVGGGYGTFSEVALALRFGRPVLALPGAPAVAGTCPAASPEDALNAVCRIVLALPADE